MAIEEIIVLASSLKVGGRCVAGVSTVSGDWVRPVSDLPDGRLEARHCRVNGRFPRKLEMVSFEHCGPANDPAQPENVLVEDGGWTLDSRLSHAAASTELEPWLVEGPELFGNRGDSVSEEDVASRGPSPSLALIEPDSISFELKRPWQAGGPRRYRALFELDGALYDLGMTDPGIRAQLDERGFGAHGAQGLLPEGLTRVLLTASLGGAFKGRHYKLAAGVIFLP